MVEAVQCPYLYVNRGSTNDSAFTYRVGAALAVQCDDGYELQGPEVVFCTQAGNWSAKAYCKNVTTMETTMNSTLIMVICSIASIIALGVLAFAVYMLCGNVKTEKEVLEQQKEQKEMEDMQNLRIYQAVTQDCVGMPAVVYGNINATLRGRPISASEGSSSNGSSEPMTDSQLELEDSKAFIY